MNSIIITALICATILAICFLDYKKKGGSSK